MTIGLLLLLLVVGILMWGLAAANTFLKEVGKVVFACALLAMCLQMGAVVALFTR